LQSQHRLVTEHRDCLAKQNAGLEAKVKYLIDLLQRNGTTFTEQLSGDLNLPYRTVFMMPEQEKIPQTLDLSNLEELLLTDDGLGFLIDPIY